jgi:hypothetical protein
MKCCEASSALASEGSCLGAACRLSCLSMLVCELLRKNQELRNALLDSTSCAKRRTQELQSSDPSGT